MTDFKKIGKAALWCALASLIFVILFFGVLAYVSVPSLLAAIGLIPVGGAVVGALIALSLFEHEEYEDSGH